jgi:hypothetical protein
LFIIINIINHHHHHHHQQEKMSAIDSKTPSKNKQNEGLAIGIDLGT